jgi:hypothetical protein
MFRVADHVHRACFAREAFGEFGVRSLVGNEAVQQRVAGL